MEDFYKGWIMKRMFIACIFLIITTACFASSLTVFVNQCAPGTIIFENTKIFEDELINYFFEVGEIVSNEPISAEEDYIGAYQIALDASKKGYIDYLAVFNVCVDSETHELISLKWQLVNVLLGSVKAQGELIAPKISNTSDIEKGIRSFAEQSGKLIVNAIVKNR